jgi:glycosyltransferase involved in cell wall biosynthesis
VKILYLANARLPTEKAHGIQIMKMCEAFANAGVGVELVIPSRIDRRGHNLFDFYGVKKNFRITKLTVLDLFIFGKFGYWVRALSFALVATIYVLKSETAVIYSRDEWPLFLLSFFRRRLFFEVHTSRFNLIVQRVLDRSRLVFSISGGLKDYFVSKGFGPDKFFLAPDGVDLDVFSRIDKDKPALRQELGLPLHVKIVGYIGKYKTMGREKGVASLIQAFSQALASKKDLFLLLVGIYEEEKGEVTGVCGSFGLLESDYKIVTHVPQDVAMRYLSVADVLVMNYPSLPHYARFMSPLKLFEYMASGNPIISSDLPSIREVLNENNSLLVSPDDPAALSRGIEQVVNNPSLAAKIAQQAAIDILKYTWRQRAFIILSAIDGR